MKEKLDFVRLPLALVAIFFVGNLILGATGVSYDVAKRFFSIVILEAHIALLWAPVGDAIAATRSEGQSLRSFL